MVGLSQYAGSRELIVSPTQGVFPSDCRSPACRRVVGARRDRDAQEHENIVAKLQFPAGSPLGASALTVIAHTVSSQGVQAVLGEPTRLPRGQVAHSARELVDGDAHLVELRLQIEPAEARTRPASALARDQLADVRRRWRERR